MTDASAHARMQRALERGSLPQAEEAAREMPKLAPADALGLVLLMLQNGDPRYERSAVRWLGKVLDATPDVGLELAAEAAESLRGLDGASPDVARAKLSMFLRMAGLEKAAERVERA